MKKKLPERRKPESPPPPPPTEPKQVRSLPSKAPFTAQEMYSPPSFLKDPDDMVMQPPFYCTVCFREYGLQDRNFYKTKSPLFAANNHYGVVCRSCLEMYYKDILAKLNGDEHRALLRIAQVMDWYVSSDIIDDVLSKTNVKNPVGALAQKMNRTNYPDGSYIDSMVEGIVDVTNPLAPDEDEEEYGDDDDEVNAKGLSIFGMGYTTREYRVLLQHYDMLNKAFNNVDSVQDALIKDLCTIKLLQMKARDNPKNYADMTNLYQSTLKNSGLKSRNMEDARPNNEHESLGLWIKQIEQYCPADVYKDQELYEDVDSLKEYIERFLLRPVRNFFSGRRDMDPEYSLTEEEKQSGA